MADDAKKIYLAIGQEDDLSNKGKVEGSVYFTIDDTNNVGKIFFDSSNTKRLNVVPDVIDCGTWKNTSNA
jgi:hypothetical protein